VNSTFTFLDIIEAFCLGFVSCLVFIFLEAISDRRPKTNNINKDKAPLPQPIIVSGYQAIKKVNLSKLPGSGTGLHSKLHIDSPCDIILNKKEEKTNMQDGYQ
jgi:hypothetical protein